MSIEDTNVPFRKMSVCKGCPELQERMNGIGITIRRCSKDELLDTFSTSWIFFGVPKDCPRYMEQLVIGQKKP